MMVCCSTGQPHVSSILAGFRLTLGDFLAMLDNKLPPIFHYNYFKPQFQKIE